MWKPLGNLHIMDLEKNCFMVKFANDQDYFKALTGGPWMILDHYLVVHQWDHSFSVSDDSPKKMVVWVRFPHLPIHLYHAQVLTSLGNIVGKTVKINFNTQQAGRGKFARIAIEIDLEDPLPPVVLLDGVPQPVEYESLPNLCFKCGRIGHVSNRCPSNPTVDLLPPPGPQVEPTTVKSSDPAVAEKYGPWLLVCRRQNRPKKEGKPLKESNIPKIDHGVKPGSDLVSRKESNRGGSAIKDSSGVISGT
ncbi:hypothetical protein LINPERPRIM_LOCUS37313 [Linum perenne]